MKWAGPAIEDLATPLAWLFATVLVVGAAVGPLGDGRDGHESGGTVTVTTTDGAETVTTTRWFTTTVPAVATTTAAATTTATMTSSTATTTTQTGTGFDQTAFQQVIWPFGASDAVDGTTYALLGLWPTDAGSPPSGPMDWSSHPSGRIGFWTVAGSAAPASLGEFDLREHDGIGPAFGPGNRGARMQLYAFDADGLFVGGIPGPQGFAHIQPQAPPGFCRPIFTYQTYYLGEGAPPTGMTDWPGLLEPYRPMLVGLLEGKRAEEAAAVPPIEVAPGSDFCGWDTLTLTGRLDLVVPAD